MTSAASAVSIVDYGVGNVGAFANVYRHLGVACTLATDPADIAAATRLVLPGVGSFDWAMGRLDASGLRSALDRAVMERGTPVLGVCVGMQMLGCRSEEGHLPGLGWVRGEVCHMRSLGASPELVLPHMGWNDLKIMRGDCRLFEGIEDPRYYFLHSYAFEPSDSDDIVATADYGIAVTAAIRRGNIHATQCHPEKSHHWGVRLLRNFAMS